MNIRFPEKSLFLTLGKHMSSVENLHLDGFSLASVISAIIRTYDVGYVIFLTL